MSERGALAMVEQQLQALFSGPAPGQVEKARLEGLRAQEANADTAKNDSLKTGFSSHFSLHLPFSPILTKFIKFEVFLKIGNRPVTTASGESYPLLLTEVRSERIRMEKILTDLEDEKERLDNAEPEPAEVPPYMSAMSLASGISELRHDISMHPELGI